MRILARRIQGLAHEVDLEGGHELIVDEPPDRGGTDTGPRPTQLLAASLAGCTAITVEMYADRKGWELGPVEVVVEMGYDGHVPNSFDVQLRLPAELDAEQRRRLLVIATRCPVHKVLAGEASVTVSERVESD
ncbi:MAG: putative redox protein [Solirubrobacterales bacterium]|nr:putative redox protein [Solirubrobacterales bacterium]